jgi:hypothetical protein
VDGHLVSASVWTGFDERFLKVIRTEYGIFPLSGNIYHSTDLLPEDHFVLLAERERIRANRMGLLLPPVSEWNQVYDNGEVRLHHRPVQTPYER